MTATVTYTLTEDNVLRTEMNASADSETPVNLAQHSYFNMGGHDSGTILNHRLTIHGYTLARVRIGLHSMAHARMTERYFMTFTQVSLHARE